MSRVATKESIDKLQNIFTYLGKNGGKITNNPGGIRWDVDINVFPKNDNEKIVIISKYRSSDEDNKPKSMFKLKIMENKHNKIKTIYIERFIQYSELGMVTSVDGEDRYHGYAGIYKDGIGLKRRFEEYIKDIYEVFLEDGEIIERYDNINRNSEEDFLC